MFPCSVNSSLLANSQSPQLKDVTHISPLYLSCPRPLSWFRSPWCVLVTQSCLTLCDPLDCSPPGSSVHGILQATILEWVAIYFSSRIPLVLDNNNSSPAHQAPLPLLTGYRRSLFPLPATSYSSFKGQFRCHPLILSRSPPRPPSLPPFCFN